MSTTVLTDTGGLGNISLELVPGRESVTAASRLCVLGVAACRHLLAGRGIDWGSGSGCLAIAAARIAAVDSVLGLEVVPEEVAAANRSAAANGVGAKVTVVHADSYVPFASQDRERLAALEARTDFLVANPPASEGDDGLGWRRVVLDGARRYVVPGAPVLMQVSFQYGERIPRLAADAGGFAYQGVVASTDLVPFDLGRPDLAAVFSDYVAEEERGGLAYTFIGRDGATMSATDAGVRAEATGESPLSRWQMHLFRRASPGP